MRNLSFFVSFLALATSACSSSDPGPAFGAGGAVGNGGNTATGGNATGSGGAGTGGSSATTGGASTGGSYATTGGASTGGSYATTGGASTGGSYATTGGANTGGSYATTGGANTGGSYATAGGANTGGNSSNGGSTATGGSSTNGGTSTGGKAGSGGTTSAGGAVATGGAASTAGAATNGGTATGGNVTTGGAATSTGGRVATGGAPATGGAVASTGGSTAGGTSGSCSRAVGACTAPTVQLTDVALGSAITSYDEGDTSVFPIMISAMPSGGSRLAWLGTDSKVHVAQLGCDDKLVGTPLTFPAVDLQDIIADDSGGVVLLTRNATNGGTDNCGTGTLCGGTSSPCRTMWMVRFNSAGTVEWETQVTNLSSSLGGYQNGARFIWWYQHHGRLAFSGTNYAAIFGVAITVNNGSCVDIHEGDRLQIVSSSGALVSAGSLDWGMSHAWTSRILWDSRTSKFAASDATDNSCRIAIPSTATTIASGACDGTLFNGDIVKSTTTGYWNAWSQGGTIRLEHFTTGASDKTISGAGSSQHPHLVSYGANNMLLTWQSGSSTAAQVRTADANASTIGSQFTIAVSDHDYGAWKAYADGSAAYAAASGSTAKIARVMPCN